MVHPADSIMQKLQKNANVTAKSAQENLEAASQLKAGISAVNAMRGDRGGDDGDSATDLRPGDSRIAPRRDYERFARWLGTSVRALSEDRNFSPYKCSIKVYRRSPLSYNGKRILCGHLPALDAAYPFDPDSIKQQIASEYGGTLYDLEIVNDRGEVLATKQYNIALPPRNIGEEEVEAVEDNNSGLTQQELLQGYVPREAVEERDARWQERYERNETEGALKHGIERLEDRTNHKFDLILQKMQSGDGNGGNGMASVIAAMLGVMQQTQQQQMEQQRQSSMQMIELIKSFSDKPRQNDSMDQVVQVLLAQIEDKRENERDKTDAILSTLQIGMQLANGQPVAAAAPKESSFGSEFIGFAKEILARPEVTGLITSLITKNNGSAEPQQLQLTKQQQMEIIDRAARQVAHEKMSQMRALPPGPPRPMPMPPQPAPQPPMQAPQPVPQPVAPAAQPDAQTRQVHESRVRIVSQSLEILAVELKERPAASDWVDCVLDTYPEEMRTALAACPSVDGMIQVILPYSDPRLLQVIGSALKDNVPAQQWLQKQAGILIQELRNPEQEEGAPEEPDTDIDDGKEPPDPDVVEEETVTTQPAPVTEGGC